jgi:hypothetical protein
VSSAAVTLCVASQQVFIVVYFAMTQSGNFWIYPRMFAFFCLVFVGRGLDVCRSSV